MNRNTVKMPKGMSGQAKVHTVMSEFKKGKLSMGKSAAVVPPERHDIAVAIALSEAKLSKKKRKKRTAKKSI